MLIYLKKLLTDETAFIRFVRAAVMAVGGMAQAGQLPFLPMWAGPALMALSVFVGAGEKNRPE